MGLVPEKGINNGEPSLHAKCIGAAAPKVGDVVIHIGAGTGYYTAILAHLVGESGRVYAYEMEADLARRAVGNLATWLYVARDAFVWDGVRCSGVLPSCIHSVRWRQ